MIRQVAGLINFGNLEEGNLYMWIDFVATSQGLESSASLAACPSLGQPNHITTYVTAEQHGMYLQCPDGSQVIWQSSKILCF